MRWALCLLPLATLAASPERAITVEGVARLHTATTGGAQYFDLSIEPTFSSSLGAGWSMTAIARLFVDGGDRLEPGRPTQATRSAFNRRMLIGDRAEIDLREAYLTGHVGRVFLTIGKQQIVWGEADRIRVLDIVNPHSLREFILPELAQSRIPLWSVRAEADLGRMQAELVYVPDETYAEPATRGALFELTSREFLPPNPTPPVALEPAITRNQRADYGARIATHLHGWDASAVYFRHTEDNPVLNSRRTATQTIVTPVYNRAHLLGASATRAFGDLTVRAEAGYTIDRGFATSNASRPDAVEHAESLSYVVGLDWYGFRDTLISYQWYQDSVLSAAPLTRPRVQTYQSGAVTRSFKNQTVKATLRALTGSAEHDWLIQASLTSEVRDHVAMFIRADLFAGDSAGIFGQFHDASRVSAGVRFTH